jgi:hypothetical protein
MGDTATQTLVHAGLLFAAIAVLAALGIWIMARFRGSKDSDQPVTSELLTKFRDLHEQGELNDQEFRNIKTLLADKLQQELKDNVEKG